MKVSAIQLSSVDNLEANLKKIDTFIKKAADAGSKMVVLPENFAFIGKKQLDILEHSEPFGEGKIQDHMATLAQQSNLWIIGGTLPLQASDNRIYGASFIWNEKGETVACYRKMHLFDVVVSEQETYQESKTLQAGDELICIETPVGKIGMSVCYDVRFPELYRLLVMDGAQILTVPSAFTETTGKAHWHVLLRARAIENLCYVIAPNQVGTHADNRRTYGHSMIVDPWGNILEELATEEGVITADIDLVRLEKLRTQFPVISHRRLFT